MSRTRCPLVVALLISCCSLGCVPGMQRMQSNMDAVSYNTSVMRGNTSRMTQSTDVTAAHTGELVHLMRGMRQDLAGMRKEMSDMRREIKEMNEVLNPK